MMCVKPFADVDDEMELAFILQNGKGLDCDKLPPEVPQAVVDMIKVEAFIAEDESLTVYNISPIFYSNNHHFYTCLLPCVS